ncbi:MULTISPECIES: ABC transporter ATP-binding protein [Methanohalophilus]|jgi:lipopolysaccharide transport system ATP-binding protein|uniref:ABC transporter ATP-binding protein n=1 Tax=Methanohalophilus euhalobius TaxID=51203 RepID=A0A285F5L2_9EURY|nr:MULTISPECIES: ABC transporter ATP-binding protein [Methanohalophilus]KXS45452.1 MAG: ABC-2 type transport system ATP-binding protein [Methanohalophilus sp. T328-1]RSD35075.1 MAG: ABC-2 type transport system ATP-binding protein [Methanohalophilus sp.]OBZ34277.1 MAG: sugar ABC transporter ATP-binding protein [Methanohalophilus sp. DAL1]ODV49996.1 MAG: ABC-2 type transport system ATP-binding protein [Methanohalophilus sp. 2-GBenrich]PQV43141.1 lipopolysaccharide transport system ATP-binding pr
MPAIEVEHLYKSFRIPHEKRNTLFEALTGVFKPAPYETFQALKDINFTVEDGEAIGIIGENGSGKSTLLKLIAQILDSTRGKVNVNRKVTPFLELGVGFQPELTAAENVKIYATIMGMPKKEIESKLDDVLDFAGLERFRDTKLKNFSSGMQVRLAFSTAIQNDPEILLLDEVLAVGDMEFQQKCLEVLKQYREKGVTIVFVSHDLGSVRRFCDRTLLLNHGEQVALDDTEKVIDQYVYGEDASNMSSSDTEADTSPAEENSEESTHQSNKKVEITDVKFYDKFGNASNRFNSSDPMVIRIFYNAHKKVLDPVFGISLYSENGEHLFGTNTELRKVSIDHVDGEGYIDLEVEKIPMLTGQFLLTVAIHTHDQKTYDWHDRQYAFDVIPTSMDAGLIEIPCQWKI